MSVLFEDWVEEVGEARAPRGYGGRFYGAYPALVRDIKDPDGQGRVKVALPWSPNGNSLKLEASGITMNASAKVTISASLLEISAGAVTVNAGFSRFNGVVQADTVISTSVVSSSYTPGAWNIW